jgi:hypothetical protein
MHGIFEDVWLKVASSYDYSEKNQRKQNAKEAEERDY